MIALYIATIVALLLAAAACCVIRRITQSGGSVEEMNDWIDVSWQSSRPIERLLSPAEFDYLRSRGMSKARIGELRAQRRKLFRMYLRRLTDEFNGVHAALRAVMVTSTVDRADLAKELAQQRVLFYRHLIGVEMRLTLNALGFETAPSLDLIRPLERLHLEFANLVPAMSGAQA